MLESSVSQAVTKRETADISLPSSLVSNATWNPRHVLAQDSTSSLSLSPEMPFFYVKALLEIYLRREVISILPGTVKLIENRQQGGFCSHKP
jgi:hypothetical protein